MIEKRRLGFLLRKLFPLFQAMGIHITRNHFYEPIPDTRTLSDAIWEQDSELIGINLGLDNQVKLLRKLSKLYKHEYEQLPLKKSDTLCSHDYYLSNRFFHSSDGQLLYAMIRYFKPKKVIEVGTGFSTYLIASTLQINSFEESYRSDYLAIDPFPNKIIRNGFPGLSKLIEYKVQEVPVNEFQSLEENDLLFIDSSHVLKIGSDVHYEYLELLPRLKKGVIVHIHDIFLPSEYPKEWILRRYRFWNEQYLLQAFLQFNTNFEVLFSCYCLSKNYPNEFFHAFIPMIFRNSLTSSFYIRKIK